MMRLLLLVIVLAVSSVAVLVPGARAAELRGDAAWTSSIRLHAPGPAGPPITVVVGPLPSGPGALSSSAGQWLGWASTVLTHYEDPITLEHELGHAFDDRNLDDAERAWLWPRLDVPAAGAWQNEERWADHDGDGQPDDPYCQHITCVNEIFADAYAGCAIGAHLTTASGRVARSGRHLAWWSTYGWRTTPRRYRQICDALWRLASPNPRPST